MHLQWLRRAESLLVADGDLAQKRKGEPPRLAMMAAEAGQGPLVIARRND
ncbi:MAG: hypothetical protein ACJAVR_000079 [Paracoccaceae bacterium]|jgi:hypothetical protein